MPERARNWETRSAHVAPFDAPGPEEPNDPRYVAHVEGLRNIIEAPRVPFGSVEEAVAWARERAPVVWVRLRGEGALRPAGQAQGAQHVDPSAWIPAEPRVTAREDPSFMTVEVRQGFRRRSLPLTSALVARLIALDAVEQVLPGRDVGDLRRLDRLPANGSVGLAVPEGGRLTCAALVRIPPDGVDAAFAFAEQLVEHELQAVLRTSDAPSDEDDPLGRLGPDWSVRARRTRRRGLFSHSDELEA